jgi:hypothetical protein
VQDRPKQIRYSSQHQEETNAALIWRRVQATRVWSVASSSNEGIHGATGLELH